MAEVKLNQTLIQYWLRTIRNQCFKQQMSKDVQFKKVNNKTLQKILNLTLVISLHQLKQINYLLQTTKLSVGMAMYKTQLINQIKE